MTVYCMYSSVHRTLIIKLSLLLKARVVTKLMKYIFAKLDSTQGGNVYDTGVVALSP